MQKILAAQENNYSDVHCAFLKNDLDRVRSLLFQNPSEIFTSQMHLDGHLPKTDPDICLVRRILKQLIFDIFEFNQLWLIQLILDEFPELLSIQDEKTLDTPIIRAAKLKNYALLNELAFLSHDRGCSGMLLRVNKDGYTVFDIISLFYQPINKAEALDVLRKFLILLDYDKYSELLCFTQVCDWPSDAVLCLLESGIRGIEYAVDMNRDCSWEISFDFEHIQQTLNLVCLDPTLLYEDATPMFQESRKIADILWDRFELQSQSLLKQLIVQYFGGRHFTIRQIYSINAFSNMLFQDQRILIDSTPFSAELVRFCQNTRYIKRYGAFPNGLSYNYMYRIFLRNSARNGDTQALSLFEHHLPIETLDQVDIDGETELFTAIKFGQHEFATVSHASIGWF